MNNESEIFQNMFGNMFGKFGVETKKDVTEKYIKGVINKEEFIKRMKNARD